MSARNIFRNGIIPSQIPPIIGPEWMDAQVLVQAKRSVQNILNRCHLLIHTNFINWPNEKPVSKVSCCFVHHPVQIRFTAAAHLLPFGHHHSFPTRLTSIKINPGLNAAHWQWTTDAPWGRPSNPACPHYQMGLPPIANESVAKSPNSSIFDPNSRGPSIWPANSSILGRSGANWHVRK